MLIAQISDCHITCPGAPAYGLIDTAERLCSTVEALNSLDPRPDLVIGTGDLTQSGMKAEYAALRTVLSKLAVPFFPCIGNHDAREPFRIAFAHLAHLIDRMGFIQYVIEGFSIRLIMLDTVKAGSDEPTLCPTRLE